MLYTIPVSYKCIKTPSLTQISLLRILIIKVEAELHHTGFNSMNWRHGCVQGLEGIKRFLLYLVGDGGTVDI